MWTRNLIGILIFKKLILINICWVLLISNVFDFILTNMNKNLVDKS